MRNRAVHNQGRRSERETEPLHAAEERWSGAATEAVGVHVILRSERPLIQNILRALIDDRTFVPAERQPMLLVFEEIPPHLRLGILQHEPEVRRDRIIAQDCVPRLQEIDGAKHGEAREQRNGHGKRGRDPVARRQVLRAAQFPRLLSCTEGSEARMASPGRASDASNSVR